MQTTQFFIIESPADAAQMIIDHIGYDQTANFLNNVNFSDGAVDAYELETWERKYEIANYILATTGIYGPSYNDPNVETWYYADLKTPVAFYYDSSIDSFEPANLEDAQLGLYQAVS